MKKLILVLLLSLASHATCFAGQFSAEGITLDVPKGFEGPLSQSMERAVVYGFTKPYPLHNSAPSCSSPPTTSVKLFQNFPKKKC
jgi:hypothetical protein